MTKHRRTKRRSQKGGFWPFTTSDPNAPTQSWGDYFSGLGTKAKEGMNNVNTGLGNLATSAQSTFNQTTDSVSQVLNKDVNLTGQDISTQEPVISTSANNVENQPVTNLIPMTTGGKYRRRSRSMKGGKGGLGLTYYATPVSGLRVVQPTTWQYYANGTNQYSIKGGSRKRRMRKSRRTRRHKRR